MKTRERIILASLDLFNEQGERNISTNHIAAHLNMSPGNLYYHFRNKNDIIYEIFKNYEQMVDAYLAVPDDDQIDFKNLVFYLKSIFSGLWAYRFLHRDLEHLLSSDEKLRAEYRQFTLRCLKGGMRIVNAMEKSRISVELPESTKQSLSLNIWLIVTNWMTFLKTMHGDVEGSTEKESDQKVTEQTINHGVYLILEFIGPHLHPDHQEEFNEQRLAFQYEGIIPQN